MNAKETETARQMVAELQDMFSLEIRFVDGEWLATGQHAKEAISYLSKNDFWCDKWWQTGHNLRINDGVHFAAYLGRKTR